MLKNPQYLLALHTIDGLGPIRLRAILDYFKDPKLAWEASGSEIRQLGIPQPTVDLLLETRKKLEPEKLAESIKKAGLKWMSVYDDSYPKLLKQIYDPPTVLYYKGEILPEDARAIGVVGSRKMTGYGKAVTESFVKDLVSANLTIVSGLARGIDGAAHTEALEAGGRTIAVLGGGLNKIFPPEHTLLAEKIAQQGAVVSEFPPDYPSVAGNFPSRNRIIAGLSLAVLVTEAAEDSGSLITARNAVEIGRDVFATPGPVTSSLSKGPIGLIRAGAKPVFDASEILDDLGINRGERVKKDRGSEVKLSEQEKQILDILENENRHVDEICRALDLQAALVSATLLKMEIAGLVQNMGGGIYCMTK